jgi:hypothetical protein
MFLQATLLHEGGRFSFNESLAISDRWMYICRSRFDIGRTERIRTIYTEDPPLFSDVN